MTLIFFNYRAAHTRRSLSIRVDFLTFTVPLNTVTCTGACLPSVRPSSFETLRQARDVRLRKLMIMRRDDATWYRRCYYYYYYYPRQSNISRMELGREIKMIINTIDRSYPGVATCSIDDARSKLFGASLGADFICPSR